MLPIRDWVCVRRLPFNLSRAGVQSRWFWEFMGYSGRFV